MTKRLRDIPYGNAKVIITDDGTIQLISYQTHVCTIRGDWLQCHGLHSRTTRKHISAFAREYTNLSYYAIKTAYEKNQFVNIRTGDMMPIDA